MVFGLAKSCVTALSTVECGRVVLFQVLKRCYHWCLGVLSGGVIFVTPLSKHSEREKPMTGLSLYYSYLYLFY